MASILNRFRRRAHEDPAAPQRASTTATEGANPSETIDHEKTGHGKHDPNVATSVESPVSELDEENDLPDDVRELPKIVRNIVSLEDGMLQHLSQQSILHHPSAQAYGLAPKYLLAKPSWFLRSLIDVEQQETYTPVAS
jgi:hypothetical protein